MNIEIRDPSVEARIQRQLRATGSGSVEEVLLRLLETQEEQDRWLFGKIGRQSSRQDKRRGIEQLDRGEGIPAEKFERVLGGTESQA